MQTPSLDAKRWPYALLVAAVLLVWGHTVSFQFVWDDKYFIEDLTSIRSLAHVPQMFYALEAQSSYPEGFVLFRPLRTLHYGVLFALGGGGAPKPWLFHLANILWHAAASILLYRMLLLLFRKPAASEESKESNTMAPWIALLCAIAFAVHPVVSEVVCWAKSLDDLMATTFVLASCCALLRWEPGGSSRPYWWGVGFFALAVYSKESAVPFALFSIPLLARLKEQKISQALRGAVPFVAVACVFVVHRHLVIGRTSQTAPLSGSYVQTLIDTLTAGPIYGRLLAGIPPFCIDYSYMKGGQALTSAAVIGGAALLLALVALSLLSLRRTTTIFGIGFLWVLLFLLPVSNLIPSMQFCAERFLYLPLIGWIVALGALLSRAKRPKPAFALTACVLVAWSALAWNRSWIWKDAVALFVQSHMDGPTSKRIQDNAVAAAFELPHMRAVFMRVQTPGQPAQLVIRETSSGPDWTSVEQTLRQLQQLFSNEVAVTTALAVSQAQQGKIDEAIPWFERATEQQPANAAFWNNLGQARVAGGFPQKAEEAFQRVVALNPKAVPALEQIARIQWKRMDYSAARQTYGTLREIDPAKADYADRLAEADKMLAASSQIAPQN